ncbi:MAG: TetR/AcrR family transcriptional regulator [Candidatus Methylomirabilota bacterium]
MTLVVGRLAGSGFARKRGVLEVKRVRLSGAARRQQIIEVAADLFSRKGFGGTTTKQVAQAIGVSETTIFKHFASKEELYAAIIEAKAHTEEILGSVTPVASQQDDAGLLRSLARQMIARVQRDPALMRLLLFSALEGHSLSDLFFRSHMQRIDDFLGRYIADRVAAGAFRPVDPTQAAWNFIGMVTHHILLRELFGQKPLPHLTVDQIIEEIVSLFLEGVRASLRPPP